MSLTAQQFDSVQCVRFGYEYGLADVIVKNKYYTKEALKALCLQCLKEKEAHIKRIEKEGDLAKFNKGRYIPDIHIAILYDELEKIFKCGYHRTLKIFMFSTKKMQFQYKNNKKANMSVSTKKKKPTN